MGIEGLSEPKPAGTGLTYADIEPYLKKHPEFVIADELDPIRRAPAESPLAPREVRHNPPGQQALRKSRKRQRQNRRKARQ